MESQLSTAQDKIGAAERCTQLLEQKNESLQKELDSWNEDTTQNLRQICNMLPMVVEFLLVVCLYLSLLF